MADHADIDHTGLTGITDPTTVKLDDLAAPDDNTDLNASTTKHGLLLKLDNTATHFLDGTGAWTTPSGTGGISSGTSFPGSPSTGDLYHRTDLTPALYRYDGTRWRCTCVHVDTLGQGDVLDHSGTDTGPYKRWPLPTVDIYVTKWTAVTQVDSTNDGTKFWTVTLRNVAAGAFASSNVDSFTTAADTQAQAVRHDRTINAAITVSGRAFLDVTCVKTSTPGAIRVPTTITYQFIAT